MMMNGWKFNIYVLKIKEDLGFWSNRIENDDKLIDEQTDLKNKPSVQTVFYQKKTEN